jgi:hypothetical protein
MNWGFPFETITNATTRTAYMSDVLRWFGVIEPPRMLPPQLNLAANSLTLTWTASAGLRYRVQFKANLADAPWHMLGADVTATNTFASQVDTSAFTVPRRFYRVLLLD